MVPGGKSSGAYANWVIVRLFLSAGSVSSQLVTTALVSVVGV